MTGHLSFSPRLPTRNCSARAEIIIRAASGLNLRWAFLEAPQRPVTPPQYERKTVSITRGPPGIADYGRPQASRRKTMVSNLPPLFRGGCGVWASLGASVLGGRAWGPGGTLRGCSVARAHRATLLDITARLVVTTMVRRLPGTNMRP